MGLLDFSLLDIIEFAASLFPNKAKIKERKQKAAVLFRSLYTECENNIQILDSFKRASFSKENTFHAVKTIASLLQNEAGNLIILGTEGVLKDLEVMQKEIDSITIEEEDSKDEKLTVKTLREAISFCVYKIQFLKTYAKVDEKDAALFKELTLKTRLDNIYNYSKQIKKQLGSYLDSMFQ